MITADLEVLRKDYPVSHALLTHDDLMTRILIRHFGPVHAVQSALVETGDTLTRRSTLHQTASGACLLNATLVIRKATLPAGFLERLVKGSDPFGGLLIEAEIDVILTDRVLYRGGQPGTPDGNSWGRRQRMLRASDGAVLCDVDELLEPEEALRRHLLPAG